MLTLVLLVALLTLILSCVHVSDVHESLQVYQLVFTHLILTSHIRCITEGVWGGARHIAFMSCCLHPKLCKLVSSCFYVHVAAENVWQPSTRTNKVSSERNLPVDQLKSNKSKVVWTSCLSWFFDQKSLETKIPLRETWTCFFNVNETTRPSGGRGPCRL